MNPEEGQGRETKKTHKLQHKRKKQGMLIRNLEEGGGEGDEESGSRPKKSAKSNDMGPVMADSKVSGKWVTKGLNNGSKQGQ